MEKELNKFPSLPYRFDLTGMDCAACGTKIEKAVNRISGASKGTVGLQTESLTVHLETPEKVVEVAEVVQKLGYGIKQKVSKPHADKEIGHSDDDGRDHSDHGKPGNPSARNPVGGFHFPMRGGGSTQSWTSASSVRFYESSRRSWKVRGKISTGF